MLLLAAISQRLRPSNSDLKARECATNLVMLVKFSGRQKVSELKNFFPETIAVRSIFILPI